MTTMIHVYIVGGAYMEKRYMIYIVLVCLSGGEENVLRITSVNEFQLNEKLHRSEIFII